MGRIGIAIPLAFLVLGCGSVKDSGGAIDATIDTPPGIDADESGTATVSTKAAVPGQTVGAVVADVDIISMLPNNTLLEMKKTDGTGNATIKVYPGGTVTAIYRHTGGDMGADLITWVGVKPGDTLEFGNRQIGVTSSTNIGTQSYSYPSVGAGHRYIVRTNCSASSANDPTLSVSVSEFSSCNKTTMDALYTATLSASPFTLTNCASRQNFTFMNGQNLAIGSWQTAVNATANITGLSATITNVTTQLGTVIDGDAERFSAQANGAPSGGAFTGSFPWCTFGERTLGTLFMSRNGNFGSMQLFDSLPSSQVSWTVANPMMPPWIEGTFLTSTHLGLVSWVLVPDGMNASDAVYASVSYTIRISNMFYGGTWHFIAPPNTMAINLPKLPAQFAEILPTTEFGMGLNRLQTFDVPTVTSYDQVRTMGTANAMCMQCAARAGDVMRVVVSGF